MRATTSNPNLDLLLQRLRTRLEALYGERLHRVVLYGSQARGNVTPGSDVDVLVVLKGDLDVYEETRRLVDVELELEDGTPPLVHLVPASAGDFARPSNPLIMNVRAEGVEV